MMPRASCAVGMVSTSRCPARARGDRRAPSLWRAGREGGDAMTVHLRSWNDGVAKAAITAFVRSVTEPGASFVPQADRIATFDNDGTLWCEKPNYPQADFLVRRWAEQVKADPARANQQPWKAVADGDRAWLAAALDHVPELIKGATEA